MFTTYTLDKYFILSLMPYPNEVDVFYSNSYTVPGDTGPVTVFVRPPNMTLTSLAKLSKEEFFALPIEKMYAGRASAGILYSDSTKLGNYYDSSFNYSEEDYPFLPVFVYALIERIRLRYASTAVDTVKGIDSELTGEQLIETMRSLVGW